MYIVFLSLTLSSTPTKVTLFSIRLRFYPPPFLQIVTFFIFIKQLKDGDMGVERGTVEQREKQGMNPFVRA